MYPMSRKIKKKKSSLTSIETKKPCKPKIIVITINNQCKI